MFSIKASNSEATEDELSSYFAVYVCIQMFERETKREKILEARQREIRLKERSRSEQSREEDGGREEGEESPDQLIARAENDFYSTVEMEQRKRREKEDEANRVCSYYFCYVCNCPQISGTFTQNK